MRFIRGMKSGLTGNRSEGLVRGGRPLISKAQNEHDVVINVAKNVVTNEDKVISLLRQDNSLSANMLANSLGITHVRHKEFFLN